LSVAKHGQHIRHRNAPPGGAPFAVGYALGAALRDLGVRPEAMIGHSIGEYVAACIAGVFCLEDALRLVVRRGQVMSEAEPGAMLSVALDRDALAPYLSDEIALAAVNSSAMSVVSGRVSAIERLQAELAGKAGITRVALSRIESMVTMAATAFNP
jgi:acyl transferase domain-containing protein